MKKKIIFLCVVVFNAVCAFSQDEGNDFIRATEVTKDYFCAGISDAFINRYNVILNYIPSINAPSKIIKVNFIIMQKGDGSNNFQHDNPNDPNSDTKRLLDRYNWICNNKMLNMYPSDSISGVTDFSDPKIAFSLNNIYFYRNDTGNSVDGSFLTLRNILINQNPYSVYYVNNYNDNPSEFNEINVYFTEGPGQYSYSHGPSYSLFSSISDCIMVGSYGRGDWATSGGITHELGHSLDLCHTYLGGGCDTSILEMNINENWFADLFGEPYPGNAPHITSRIEYLDCPAIAYPWDADPYDNTLPMAERLTNNIMGNQGNTRNYLSPSQIGKAHRSLCISSVRRYVVDDCYDQNDPIVVGSDEIWDFNIRVYQDIIIEDGAECTFSCHVELPYNAKIIVRDGSTLIVDGSISGVNESAWKGQIEVEPGGELIIEDDGEIILGEGGSILIDQSETDIATLTYNAEAEIILNHASSFLEILGNLFIGNNAQFTFTGNGYVKFSNPGPDATYNITCGTGASMLFSGSGQSDKVLEIQQNTVHFPQLSSLTFQNCKIEMGTSKRMQTDVSYPVTFNNVKVTSTTGSNNSHRSFLFIGQSNVTINNCIFEYGLYGLNANLTYTNGSPLYITNSTFRFNTQGLNIYGKGLHLENCSVINNTSYGVYCNAMSFTSDFTDCTINDNNYGIYYIGSASADIDIENTYIQSNNYDGVKTSGAFDVNMECAYINENRYGLYTLNGTYIKPYTCDISANTRAIYFNYGSVYLLNKYNQLQSLNDGFTLYGYIPALCGGGSPLITATHNRWESDPVVAVPAYNINYKLWVYNCSPTTTINLTDNDPSYLSCISPFSLSPPSDEILPINQAESIEITDNELPLVSISGTQMPVDEAVPYLANQIDNSDSETDYLMLIEQYSSMILNCDNYTTVEVKLWMDMAYNDLHNIVSDFYEYVNFDNSNSSFNHGIDDIIQLNKSLLDNPNLIYTDYVEYNIDIALLDRIRENYSMSIPQLENLASTLVDENCESEYQFVLSWLCKIEAEKAASEGLLSLDEFMLAIEDCNLCMSIKSAESSDNTDTEEIFEKSTNTNKFNSTPGFYVSPNPNNGSFTITLNDPCENCEVRIINSVGQLVKSIRPTQKEIFSISIDGLTTGHYNVLYLIDNSVKHTATVVVKQ